MGNSHANSMPVNQTHSHQPYHPAAYHHEIRNFQQLQQPPPNNNKVLNPEYKVLPERIPGQKLRITDNGNILQNGGTLSGRPPTNHQPPPTTDVEFLRLLRRRAEDGPEDVVHHEVRYYDPPELQGNGRMLGPVHHVDNIDGNYNQKGFRKKTKAPPPPSVSPDRGVMRTNSFQEAVSSTGNSYVQVQPWQNRSDSRMTTSSMEKIIEHREIVVQQETRMYKTRAETLPWNNNKSPPPVSESPVSRSNTPQYVRHHEMMSHHDRRFYKHQSSESSHRKSQSEVQLNGNVSGHHQGKYTGPMDSHERWLRAKSMDSLQVAMENERLRQMGKSKMRMSMDNLNGVPRMSPQPHSMESTYSPARHQHTQSSELREEMRRSSSRQEDYQHRLNPVYSTGSLQRSGSPIKYGNPDQLRKGGYNNHKLRGIGDASKDVPSVNDLQHDGAPKQQYYYGEFLTMDNRGRATNDLKGHHRSGSSSSLNQSRGHLDDKRVLSSKHEVYKKYPEVLRPESQVINGQNHHEVVIASDRGVTQNGVAKVIMRTNDTKNVNNGRQRNSYAFEDPRYRYEGKLGGREHFMERPTPPRLPEEPKLESTSIEDELDISMQLRPTLPKRLPAIPRFSPTQAWRALNLEHITNSQGKPSDRSSEDGEVFEDRIHRITRPMAPPRSGNGRSADSGISQDAGSPGLVTDFDIVVSQEKRSHLSDRQKMMSPPALLLTPDPQPSSLDGGLLEPSISPIEQKRTTWTPEEDLASDFDGGSGDHVMVNGFLPVMVSAQPRLTSIKSMFIAKSDQEEVMSEKKVSRKKGRLTPKLNDHTVPHTFNSMRKLKRSLSGAMGSPATSPTRSVGKPIERSNVDENWSFSRSLPNSLHNGYEGEKTRPKSSHELIPPVDQYRMRRAESGPIHPGPIHTSPTFQGLQSRVMSMDSLHNTLYYQRHGVTLNEGSSLTDGRNRYSTSEHIIYLPEYDAKKIVPKDEENGFRLDNGKLQNGTYASENKKKGKKFSYQSTVRQQERRRLEQKLSQEVAHKEKVREREKHLVNKVEEEFQRKREREKATICQQLQILSTGSPPDHHRENSLLESPPPPLMSASIYHEDFSSSTSPLSSQPTSDGFGGSNYTKGQQHAKLEKQDSGFFGGISKWMRRQQRLEDQSPINPGSPDPALFVQHPFDGPAVMEDYKAMPADDVRHRIISSAKFSSGETPLEQPSSPVPPPPHQNGFGGKNSTSLQVSSQQYLQTQHETLNTGQYWQAIPEYHPAAVKVNGRAPAENGTSLNKPDPKKQQLNKGEGSGSSMDESTTSSVSMPPLYRNGNAGNTRQDPPAPSVRRPRSSIEDSDRSSDEEEPDRRRSNGRPQHSRYRSPDRGGGGGGAAPPPPPPPPESSSSSISGSKKPRGSKKHKDAKTNGHKEGSWDDVISRPHPRDEAKN